MKQTGVTPRLGTGLASASLLGVSPSTPGSAARRVPAGIASTDAPPGEGDEAQTGLLLEVEDTPAMPPVDTPMLTGEVEAIQLYVQGGTCPSK